MPGKLDELGEDETDKDKGETYEFCMVKKAAEAQALPPAASAAITDVH